MIGYVWQFVYGFLMRKKIKLNHMDFVLNVNKAAQNPC